MDDKFYRKGKTKPTVGGAVRKLLKNKRLTAGLIAGLIVFGGGTFGGHGFIARIRLTSQKAELESKIAQAKEDSTMLVAKSKALDGDRNAIERVARENYNMVREGETMYRVKKK